MLLDPDVQPVPARILVVEDEVLIRFVLADELRLAGFTVIEAACAAEALAYIAAGGAVDLVFSDVHMPGSLDGLDLARLLRAQYPLLPIILTSGNPGSQSLEGLAMFVAKPYGIERALSIIFETLGLQRPGGW
jgi:two-component system, response regulator PdtaR